MIQKKIILTDIMMANMIQTMIQKLMTKIQMIISATIIQIMITVVTTTIPMITGNKYSRRWQYLCGLWRRYKWWWFSRRNERGDNFDEEEVDKDED